MRGLASPWLRRKAWPLLLGIEDQQSGAAPCLLHSDGASGRNARDVQTIANDVARCLHESQVDVGSQDREELRSALIRLLRSVVDGQNTYYYQVRLLQLHSFS